MLHYHDGKADCSDVLYISSVRMSVYHAIIILMKGFHIEWWNFLKGKVIREFPVK